MAYLDNTGLAHFWAKIKAYAQEKLVSGTNIKTINNQSLLGSGNISISGGSADVGNAKVFYGTCATAAATRAKVVVCNDFAAADLVAGTTIFIKFTNAQTYNGAPTLNIHSTGAKGVVRSAANTTPRYVWSAGEMVCFTYDGTNWVMVQAEYATTTYWGRTKLSSAIDSTSNAYAATPGAVKQAYDHADDVIAPTAGVVTLVYTGGGGQLEVGTGVWRSGNVATVHLRYSSTSSMAWNNETIASIPQEFAPSSDMRFPIFATADWTNMLVGYAQVQANGNIIIYSKSTKAIFGTFTYVIAVP